MKSKTFFPEVFQSSLSLDRLILPFRWLVVTKKIHNIVIFCKFVSENGNRTSCSEVNEIKKTARL